MINLNANAIAALTSSDTRQRIAQLKTFAKIDSTNSYLMQLPGPPPGKISIAVTSNQTAGRGRHGRTWQSPPGSGLCLSAAYTFQSQPKNLPMLTLALGLGAVTALQELGASGVAIKWPNDLVALDAKLGGILTEVQTHATGAVTVVSGIGVNIRLPENIAWVKESGWARGAVDLSKICDVLPSHESVAARLTSHLLQAFMDYEVNGFTDIARRWPQYDWLFEKSFTVDTVRDEISGTGAGIADDGALLVATSNAGIRRVTSGTISMPGAQESSR